MLVIIKSKSVTVRKFKSLHNAALFKEEFIENFIMSKEGNSPQKMTTYSKPKTRHEWLNLPKGYLLTRKESGDFAKITCYDNRSSNGILYNDYTVNKVFSIFILRIESSVKIPEPEVMGSAYIANHQAMLEEIKSKAETIAKHFNVDC